MSGLAPSTTWSYRAGPWYAGFGPEVAVLVPRSQRDAAGALWTRIDAGSGFDELLDGLLAIGLRHLPAFVLIDVSGHRTRLVVRGEGVSATVVTGDERVTVDGPAREIWAERSVEAVESLTVTVPTEGIDRASADVDREIVTGLVPVGRIDRPARTATTSEHPRASGPVLAAVPDVGAAPDTEVVPDVTEGPAAVARLRTSDGQEVLVDRVVLIGRAPVGRAEAAALLTVPSPLKEISSTHVEVRPGAGEDRGLAVVTDMGSTNGTAVTQPEREPLDLRPGIALALRPGALIDLGDGITVEVARP